jgi:hypothetical protein
VASGGDEEDRSLGSEVALLRAQPAHHGLDVVESGFGLDDGVECSRIRHPIGAAQIAGDRNRHLGPPTDRRVESRSESVKHGDVPLIPHRRTRWMDPQAQVATNHCRDAREKLDVDMRCQSSFDPEDLGVGNADRRANLAGTQPRRDPRNPELITDPPEQVVRTPSGALSERLPGGHAAECRTRPLPGTYLRLEHPEVPTDGGAELSGAHARDSGPDSAVRSPFGTSMAFQLAGELRQGQHSFVTWNMGMFQRQSRRGDWLEGGPGATAR